MNKSLIYCCLLLLTLCYASSSAQKTSATFDAKPAPELVPPASKQEQQLISPSAALQRLQDGQQRFKSGQMLHRDPATARSLTAHAQYPYAVVLTCIDSRTAPELVFDQGIGDIFDVRIAGNVVTDDILGSMEFACKVAGARLIVVMGHSQCGAVKGACDQSGRYHEDMNSRDTLDTQLNVLSTFDPVIPDAYQDCEFLMLGNLMPSIQMQVMQRLKNRPKLIVMDTMNFWMEIAWDDLMKNIKMIDVLTVNDAEARQLTNEYSLVKAARKILQMGPKYLIIKKGEHGALLFHENKVFFAPALPLEEVFDPTGAGDTFAGGFIGYLASVNDISFESMKRAVIYGSAMASFCVEKFGLERIVELNEMEVDERVQEFIDLVQFDITLV